MAGQNCNLCFLSADVHADIKANIFRRPWLTDDNVISNSSDNCAVYTSNSSSNVWHNIRVVRSASSVYTSVQRTRTVLNIGKWPPRRRRTSMAFSNTCDCPRYRVSFDDRGPDKKHTRATQSTGARSLKRNHGDSSANTELDGRWPNVICLLIIIHLNPDAVAIWTLLVEPRPWYSATES